MKIYSVFLMVVIALNQTIAQTPQFELVTPDGVPDIHPEIVQEWWPTRSFFKDYDGDDDLDLLVGNHASRFYTYNNDGLGNLDFSGVSAFSDIVYTVNKFDFEFADFNGDDIPDLIMAKQGDDHTRIYYSDGAGNYTESSILLHGGAVPEVIVKDVDSDGDMDIFLQASYTVSVFSHTDSDGRKIYIPKNFADVALYINNGGDFSEKAIDLTSEGYGSQIDITSTFDGTKRNLFIEGNFDGTGTKIRLYHYDGTDFTFVSDALFAEGNGDMYLGDINGDGMEDLLFANDGNGFRFYLNDGPTSYAYDNTSNLHDTPVENFIFSDINNDSYADLIFAQESISYFSDGDTYVYHGDGTGDFNLSETLSYTKPLTSSGWFLGGDITGDGYVDFFQHHVLNTSDGDIYERRNLYVNNGDGTFDLVENDIVKEVDLGAVSVVDIDNDHDNDLILAGETYLGESASDVYLNDGAGLFTNFGSFKAAENGPAATHDFNRDGNIDLLIDGTLYLNNGAAELTSSASNFSAVDDGDILKFHANADHAIDVLLCGSSTKLYMNYELEAFSVVESASSGLHDFEYARADAGDLDNDGDTDLILTGNLKGGGSGDYATYIYLNDGNGYFNEIRNTSLEPIVDGDVKIIHIDGDEYLDIIIAGDGVLNTYLNDGDGQSFTLSQELDGLSNATITVADVDEDGDDDFVASGFDETIGLPRTNLYLNDGIGNFIDSEVSLRGIQEASIVFEDMDGDLDLDLFLSGTEVVNGNRAFISRVYENTSSIATIDKKASVCDSYWFIDEALTVSGNYMKFVTTPEGESRAINLDLTVGAGQSETVDITAQGYYVFNGKRLTNSGTYDETLVSSTGCDSLVTLNLTLNDYEESAAYDHIAFELIQPLSSPQIPLDFETTWHGGSLAYDMDGDGDNDFLMIAQTIYGKSEFISYRYEADGSYTRIDHGFTLSKKEGRPLLFSGDMNSDGIEDLIVGGERYVGGLSTTDLGTNIYLGDNEGGLTLVEGTSFASALWGFIDVVDLSGDGIKDIVIGHYLDGTMLYVNDGNASFTSVPIPDLDIDAYSWNIDISEPYNGGVRDIVIADNYTYELYRYDGVNYTFISDDTFASYEGSTAIFGDANADGAPDLLVSSVSASVLTKLYINDGSGNYAQSTENFDLAGTSNSQVKFADLNKDGAFEVLVDDPNALSDDLIIFWNDGSGNYTSGDQFKLGQNYSISIGDINNDTYPDIIYNGLGTINSWTAVSLINNQSNGFDEVKFSAAGDLAEGDADFADIDNDGDQDLLLVGDSRTHGAISEVLINDGNGNFEPSPTETIDSLKYSSISIADFDGNNYKDVVISGMNNSDSVITKIFSNIAGDLTFQESIVLPGLGKGVTKFLKANDDEYYDILFLGEDTIGVNKSFMYLNDGAGGFTTFESGVYPFSESKIATGDVNGDKFDDLLICGTGAFSIPHTALYLANGDGTYYEQHPNQLKDLSNGALDIVDVDLDGDNDIYLSGIGFQQIFINDGMANFTPGPTLDPVWNSDVKFEDVDWDGDYDFIVSGTWSTEKATKLYVNDGSGNFTEVNQPILKGVSDGKVEFSDIDGDLDKDLLIFGKITGSTYATRIYRNTTEAIDVVIWQDAAWSNTTGPTTSDRVIINDDYDMDTQGSFQMASLQINEDKFLSVSSGETLNVPGDIKNNGFLTVGSGGSLLTYAANSKTGTGEYTFGQFIRFKDGRYSMVGTPVSNGTEIGSDLGPAIYSYNESIPYNDGTEDGVYRWINALSEVPQPGKGYALAADQFFMSFTGTPNDGDISFTALSRTEDVTTTSNNWGWHLVSNPYPASLNLESFLTANTDIQGSIALWDDGGSHNSRGDNGDYLIVNGLGSVSGPNGGNFDGYINPMQGFFVQVGDGQTGDLIFTEDMREIGNNDDFTFFRRSEQEIPGFKLVMKRGGDYSETLIGFPDDAKVGVDRLYDAAKIKASSTFNVFTLIGEDSYAIQGLPLQEEVIVPLGIDIDQSGVVTFNLTEADSFLEDYLIFLKNNHTEQLWELTPSEASIYVEVGVDNHDYSLIVQEKKNILNIPEIDEYIVFANQSEMLIQGDIGELSSYSIIDINGRIITQESNISQGGDRLSITRPSEYGLYIIQLSTANNIEVHKIILN